MWNHVHDLDRGGAPRATGADPRVVGLSFAPLKPAELANLTLKQEAGQSEG
jgi:hypothetical protein